MENTWIYQTYFSELSNTVSHYQYLITLTMGAAGFISFNTRALCIKIIAVNAFIISAVNLIIGLFIYKSIISTVFDFTISVDKGNLMTPFKCLVNAQFILGILALILLMAAGGLEIFLKERRCHEKSN